VASVASLAIASPAVATGGGLIAPTSVCPGQETLSAPAAAQEATMLCMTGFARAHTGLTAVAATPELEQSAGDKGDDILRCDSFSHFACGREFTYWMRQAGYMSTQCWRVGENLAWGTDEYGTVRSIFRAWMSSPGHRANILGDFTQVGIGLRVGTLEGQPGTHVWAQHFGSHCEAPPAQS
jgi:serralysin